ncbi:hypothetical protein V1478_011787 [Vespula squamosa]|uniref:Uncharacterized protein n=1 Tax=Vespula squamosa TaxID=30214 RepID=A0ABD2ABC2_VESSQ
MTIVRLTKLSIRMVKFRMTNKKEVRVVGGSDDGDGDGDGVSVGSGGGSNGSSGGDAATAAGNGGSGSFRSFVVCLR